MAKHVAGGGYDVGYGKPPAERRFVKGRSGNPKGRPKKAAQAPAIEILSDTTQLILADARRPIKMRTADGETAISSIEAVLQSTKASALKGNVQAQRVYTQTIDRAQRNDDERWKKLCELVHDYQRRHKEIAAEIQRRGLADKIFVPHPDDYYLNAEARQLDLLGPMGWEDQKFMEAQLSFRCQLLWAVTDWSLIGCKAELRTYVEERILARWNTARYLSRFVPARFALGPLEDYVFEVPSAQWHGMDPIIFGVLVPILPYFAKMFAADSVAQAAFFRGPNFLSECEQFPMGDGLYYRPAFGPEIDYDARARIDAQLDRATTSSKQIKVLETIARGKTTLPAHVAFNARSSLAQRERRSAQWMIDDFRRSLV